jgi:molecular chaperone GrpE
MSLYDERPHAEESVEGTEPEEAAASEEAAAPEGRGSEHGYPTATDSAVAADAVDPVARLAHERDEYLLALQRTQADFENYRKRITRQQGEQTARAASDLVHKLLPVLDTLDLAEAHFNESLDLTEDGKALRASRAMLMDILAKEGLERVDQRNVPFDPSVHDAVAHTEGLADDPETMVDEVLRSGYRWKGQVLRPAMVRVRG